MKQYVMSRDIKWDKPRQYRKLSLEATRDPSATAISPEWEQRVADANQFAALISDSDSDDEDEETQEQGGKVRREVRNLATSYNTGDQNLGQTRSATRAMVNSVEALYKDPENDREALEGPEAKQWMDGLVKEYNGFFEISTWKLVKHKDAKLGHGNKPLTTKNVYKKKAHAITKEPRYRVRNCI